MRTAQPQDAVADLTLRDIAKLQRCSTDTVRRHHATWTKNSGFPAPVLLAGVRGPRWSAAAVNIWRLQRAACGTAGQPGGAVLAAATDWHEVAAARGALLDAGVDPDTFQPLN